ncbi:hypothetical protein V2J09_003899 [Rumex salicifolius]
MLCFPAEFNLLVVDSSRFSLRFSVFRNLVPELRSTNADKSSKKPNDLMKLFAVAFLGIICGFSLGLNLPMRRSATLNHLAEIVPDLNVIQIERESSATELKHNDTQKIWTPSNPRGTENLPPGIVVSESDFNLHRLWGNPSEDLPSNAKYLVAFTVGCAQKKNVDLAVKKFAVNFTIVLFHYDRGMTEWDEFEWSKRAIHVSAVKQTKWWFAKRFLHPDIVAPYDYIFIWDEDLGVEHFNAEEYIKLVKKHGLEISQPGLDSESGITWEMTRRRDGQEVHKQTEEKPGWCSDPYKPPCAGFVEIMAPVFSRDAWRCAWHMIQNDLVHGWGLDFAFGKCAQPAYMKIGVVDAQWILHQRIPSLGDQGEEKDGQQPWRGVRERCHLEWKIFGKRLEDAEQEYSKNSKVNSSRAH